MCSDGILNDRYKDRTSLFSHKLVKQLKKTILDDRGDILE